MHVILSVTHDSEVNADLKSSQNLLDSLKDFGDALELPVYALSLLHAFIDNLLVYA